MINFNASAADAALINKLVERAEKLFGRRAIDRLSSTMDLTACHLNGCPLDLQRLLEDADDFNFMHDFTGIARHLDRDDASPTAGQLLDCFLPRFAKRDPLPESWMLSERELAEIGA